MNGVKNQTSKRCCRGNHFKVHENIDSYILFYFFLSLVILSFHKFRLAILLGFCFQCSLFPELDSMFDFSKWQLNVLLSPIELYYVQVTPEKIEIPSPPKCPRFPLQTLTTTNLGILNIFIKAAFQ